MSLYSTLSGSLALLLATALGLMACSKSTPAAGSAPSASAGHSASAAPKDELRSCAECESESACVELMEPCKKFSGDDAKKCEAVSECVVRTGCGHGKRTFTSCFCGDLGTAECLKQPKTDGPCKDVLLKAFGDSKDNLQLLQRYIEPEYPGGAALARLNCLKFNCSPECSLNKDGPQPPGRATPP